MAEFRIESVKIEGFKAFTKPQTIPINGKNLFIFGDNGTGKSSIVDAINWCIWGGKSEERKRNVFYTGDCQVELFLKGPDGLWHLRRRMRRESEESDIYVYNPQGQLVGYQTLFPYLPKITGEGIYVIMAEQQPIRGRPYIDISRFDQVIYAYLGILELKELLKELTLLLQEFENSKQKLASEVEKIKNQIKAKYNEVDQKLKELLGCPPWEGGGIPTMEVTWQKIQDLASSLGIKEPLPKESPLIALDRIARFVEEKEKIEREPLEKDAQKIRNDITQIQYLWRLLQEYRGYQDFYSKKALHLKKELEEICQRKTFNELEDELKRLTEETNIKARHTKVLQEAEYLAQTGGSCPVCGCQHDDLLHRIHSFLERMTPEQKQLTQKLQQFNEHYSKAKNLHEEWKNANSNATSWGNKVSEKISELRQLLSLPIAQELGDAVIQDYIKKKQSELIDLDKALQNRKQWVEDRRRDIKNLKEELHFHELRRKREYIQWWLDQGFFGVEKEFNALCDALASIQEIKEVLKKALWKVLSDRKGPLSELLTEVYQHLTKQSSFERVYLDLQEDEKGLELSIKVYSRLAPDRLWDPEKVLNGQALNALRLVPYFVFSRFQTEGLPLGILMLDDPGQRFDTSHIQYLLEELRNAASHSQLIVATHEEERFSPYLDQYFPLSERLIIKVKSFSPGDGPVLEQPDL